MKNRIRYKIGYPFRIAIVLTMIMVLAYCLVVFIRDTPEAPPPVDDSLLSVGDCSLPCWQGIVPGKTTAPVVLEAIRNIVFIPQNFNIARLDVSDPDSPDVIYWFDNQHVLNRVLLKKGLLYKLEIHPNFKAKLQDILAVHGIPEAVDVRYEALRGSATEATYLRIFYPKKGLSITLLVSKRDYTRSSYVQMSKAELDVSFKVVTPTSSLLEFVMNTMDLSVERATEFINNQVITNWRGEDAVIYLKDDLSFSGLLLTATPKP